MTNEIPKPQPVPDLLNQPGMDQAWGAGIELIHDEPAVSMDVLGTMGPTDTLALDCGHTKYRLQPTTIPDAVPTEGKSVNNIFMVTEAVDERTANDPNIEPYIKPGSVILVDGTGTSFGGSSLRPRQLVRNGYLSFRVPFPTTAEERTDFNGKGWSFTETGQPITPDGRAMWNPTPRTSELMSHIIIEKEDGTSQQLF